MTQADGPTSGEGLPLSAWSELPLHRVVASAAIDTGGGLSKVGGIDAKVARVAADARIRALGVCAGQPMPSTSADDLRADLRVLQADTAAGLAAALASALVDVYGEVTPLPDVLVASPAAQTRSGFDYTAGAFQAFGWLDALVAGAIQSGKAGHAARAPHVPDPSLPHDRGYIHILGPAGCGKTSWALNWVRRSLGEVSGGGPPLLAGWYFARRFGLHGTRGRSQDESELAALQTLVSLARRSLDLVPAEPERQLLDANEARRFANQSHLSRSADSDEEIILRERFVAALQALAAHARPDAQRPLVFLVDGGDEMWRPDPRPEARAEWAFPRILPTLDQLPPHVYLVLLSRPGTHMQGFDGREPLLRCSFEREDVDRSIRAYLTQQAERHARLRPGDEAASLLADDRLQRNICAASEGAFGYVTLLLRHWLPESGAGAAGTCAQAGGPRIRQDLEQLREWRDGPGSLPQGVYGLRAREFLEMKRQAGTRGDAEIGIAELLALLTQLRWPMKRSELIELLCPGASNKHPRQRPPLVSRLEHLLNFASTWMGSPGAALGFAHQSMSETAQAAWRLEVSEPDGALTEAALADEARGEDSAAAAEDTLGQVREHRRRAEGWLHATLAEGLLSGEGQRGWREWRKKLPTRPWVRPGERLATPRAYDLVWGPMHAMAAALAIGDEAPGSVRAAAAQARELLLDAAYLESSIRASAAFARQNDQATSAHALRECFIVADELTGEDPEGKLRHRVESALLHWHEHIAEGRLQVGTMLWNLLGADELGRIHAQRWRASLDEPAIISKWPGRPSDLDRQIPARAHAVTPCGHWLVTSDGHGTTEIWDLRQGWRRAIVRWRLDWACGSELQADAQGNEIAIGGVWANRAPAVFLGVVDSETGRSVMARYAGHRSLVNCASLCGHYDRKQIVWGLASGSGDEVGLLLRTREQIENDALRSGTGRRTLSAGVLARYAGHSAEVLSVSLQCHQDSGQTVWALASGSWDCTVGLLLRTSEQIEDDARRSNTDDATPNACLLARYAGHRDWVRSVSLQGHYDGRQTVWAVASGSHDRDNTVGLLLRTRKEVDDDARRQGAHGESPNTGVLARYAGHCESVYSVSLQGHHDGCQTVWGLASGSYDRTVGLLLRTREQVEDDARRVAIDDEAPNTGLLARYAGHRTWVRSVSLKRHHDGLQTVWALASGSWDATVGLLVRTREQVEDDARRSGADLRTPNAGVLARYAGHRGYVQNVSLYDQHDGRQTVWALASRSDDHTVGLLLRTRKEIEEDARRLGTAQRTPNAGVLARYAGHRSRVQSVSLQGHRDGRQTVWALASGSADKTVGLLLRTQVQVEDDARRSGTDDESPNAGLMARYAGHRDGVLSVSLRGHHDGRQAVWALASGSDDETVGLMLRTREQVENDARRAGTDGAAPNAGLLARYAGHGGDVLCVSAHGRHDGRQTVWAVASGSAASGPWGYTVGLLLRTREQIEDDARRSGTDDWAPNAGLLARYAGHRGNVESVSLQDYQDGRQTVWVLASGSNDHAVGLLLRTSDQIEDDSRRSKFEYAPNANVLARYAGHRGAMVSVSLQGRYDGQQTVWALASGSVDGTTGVITFACDEEVRAHRDSTADDEAHRTVEIRPSGLAQGVILRQAEPPHDLLPMNRRGASANWIGGNDEAFVWWSAAVSKEAGPAIASADRALIGQSGLVPRLVCPLGSASLRAMDFAASPDGKSFAVGGAIGNDVAILMLEVLQPEG